MPTPLVAFPCGSPSMSSVLCSAAARLAARFTAVVVLPTPPFWFAMAITRATFFRDLGIEGRLAGTSAPLLHRAPSGGPIYPCRVRGTTCHVAHPQGRPLECATWHYPARYRRAVTG